MTALRDRFRRFFQTDILVRVTNLGLGFVLTTLVVAIGATNTGNNGLYILLALFLAVLVVSGLVSRRNVEDLTVSLDGPEEIFAGEPARFVVRLVNRGRLPRRALLVKVSGASSPLLFPRLDPLVPESRAVDLIFTRRGKRTLESLLVYSGYPIGLFRKGRLHPVAGERLVYPSPRRFDRPLDLRGSEGDGRPSPARGEGADVRHLREAGPGDALRDIHWRQTARQGRLIAKDRGAERSRDALVVLDVARPAGAGPSWDTRFERAVSEATGLVLRLLSRGDRVGLVLGERVLPPGAGPVQRAALLGALALVEPEAPAGARGAAPAHALGRSVRLYELGVSRDAA